MSKGKSEFRISSSRSLTTTPVFDAYWHFAYERQEILFRRLSGEAPPWTEDQILKEYRFTNAYRASDRVSQHLIRHVIYEGIQSEEEVFFRTILFKLFNNIATWKLLESKLGPLSWGSFNLEKWDRLLCEELHAGRRIYSAAYIMPSPAFGESRKHTNHLRLLASMMKDRIPLRVAASRSLGEVFHVLRSCPSLGDFLAFQFTIDLNYSPLINFSEMDFVVAGPGARSGIQKAFSNTCGLGEEDVIRAVTEFADREFSKRGLQFRSLWGRSLQLIDCQNLFCEVDKYSRVAFPNLVGSGRKRIKQRFLPKTSALEQWYPPKWGLQASAISSTCFAF